MAMAATSARVSSLDALNRLTACPRCASAHLTAVGAGGFFDGLAWISMPVAVGTKRDMPPRRTCKDCGWIAEVA